MQNSEFEKSMQQRMDELKFVPSDAVWTKIEAGLPEQKKPRRWLLFFLLFIALSGTTLMLINYFSPVKKYKANSELSKKEINANKDVSNQMSKQDSHIKINDVSSNNKLPIKDYSGIGNKNESNISLMNNSGVANKPSEKISGDLSTNKKIKFKTKQKVKIVIKPSFADFGDAVNKINVADSNETLSHTTVMIIADSMIALSEIPNNEIQNSQSDSLKNPLNNTLSTLKKNPLLNKKKTANRQFGINMGVGISTVKNKLFGNSPLYADVLGNYSSGSPNVQVGSIPNSPKASTSFNLGFYVKNKMNKRWIFNAGLNYSYQSNIIKAGSNVDSVINFNFAGTNIRADQFYRNGQSVRYKNVFHLASIPLLFQYGVSKKIPLYVEMGSTLGYLIYSNTLIYNSSSNAYFTNEGLFNKILLTVNAGAGNDLSKNTKLPFSVGYRFSYSIGSATKTTYSKQHLLNSLLFLDIPLKK